MPRRREYCNLKGISMASETLAWRTLQKGSLPRGREYCATCQGSLPRVRESCVNYKRSWLRRREYVIICEGLSNCLWHIRHRAWVGGLRLRGRSLGSRGMLLEGFSETVLRPLGSRFGASWGLFWVSWGLLGASWGLLGASWGLLEASWGGRFGFSVRVPPLGPLLGPSWGPLGPS